MGILSRSKRKPTGWRRIYRQTITLIHKNFLLFYAAPISTLFRALIFPLLATTILCSLRHLRFDRGADRSSGFSEQRYPIRELSDAMSELDRSKLVFVTNGTSQAVVDPLVNGIKKLPRMDNMEVVTIVNSTELFDVCRQSVVGRSTCYAAIIFVEFNEKSVDYRIAMDPLVAGQSLWGNWKHGNDMMANYFLPLQWAVNSQINNISASMKPSTRTFYGSFGPNYVQYEYIGGEVTSKASVWLTLVATFVAPVFILALIGVVYHEATFVATERESSMAELMSSQEVTIVPRILSTIISFFVLYLPGFIGSSIIMTQILFVQTSDGLLLFLTILAGLSMVTSTHFLASFFGKANLAGLYSSTLVFALALVMIAATMTILDVKTQITGLAAVFPPYTWSALIADIAYRANLDRGFTLKTLVIKDSPLLKVQYIDGSLYIIFFLVQIVAYGVGTYFVEKYLWGVSRPFEQIDATSDVALRCTGLSKTYLGKRRWYWPFSRAGEPLVAVDGLDLEVKKGSVTFLLGPNGGGKTTTIKCIAGITAMDIGSRLELNEDNLVFGICPQNNVFWRGLTVRQHIDIWQKLKTAARPAANNDDVIAECDLLEKADAKAHTLSGGQMRKLQLAIAFCGGSKICCIDEASSGLDPLSRRAIWNIIQKGQIHRTVLITTHFLDEADVLANHIAIVYKGKLVCEGPSTTLKAQYGDNYLIRNHKKNENNDTMTWRMSNSTEATKKLLELEAHDNDNTYDVTFPTLEQVFLKVTSDTAVHAAGGDGFVGELETAEAPEEKIFALEIDNQRDIELDVGLGTGFLRQVQALFVKRYILLQQKSGWIAYLINLAIPIIIAGAIAKFLREFKSLDSCEAVMQRFHNPVYVLGGGVSEYSPVLQPTYASSLYLQEGFPLAILGPETSWAGEEEKQLYASSLGPKISNPNIIYESDIEYNETVRAEAALIHRRYATSIDDIVTQITNYSGLTYYGVGMWKPVREPPIFFYQKTDYSYSAEQIGITFNLLTNMMARDSSNTGTTRVVNSGFSTMRQPVAETDFRSLPIAVLVVLALLAATSIAIIYPSYEKLNNVRALHYCNGVMPAALWLGYLLFDLQFIVVQAIVVWGAMFAGNVARLYYESSFLLGVFILFGLATYLGNYLVSLFVKKAAFAIAAGTHILLLVLYLVSYIVVEAVGDKDSRHATYSLLQSIFGLSSPAANLLSALMLSTNTFGILCGQFADNDISNPMGYERYGSVYANLLIQTIFLVVLLGVYEYGSADFVRRTFINRGVPSRLHYRVDASEQPMATARETQTEKTATASVGDSARVLQVSSVSKYFGKTFAVENVSFDIAANETLALLGGNGAGKTTLINMIRGSIRPNFGDIFLEGTSVLRNPAATRHLMGVCPQDDAVDNLTVRQTLRFYATVKGLKDIEGNVDKVLNALNITIYEALPVRALSGGTKRKLSVAIALLGNPRILLLDEPSTGQDAGAKRILWRALQDVSANRAILLTTHSMEEAEKLATSVAIVGTRMLAMGTLGGLQERYGGTFVVRAVRADGMDADDVKRRVETIFQHRMKDYQDHYGQVSFGLPHDKTALGTIMKAMEELKGERVEEAKAVEGSTGGSSAAGGSSAVAESRVRCFSDYTINGPTLEEVFMNVARDLDAVGGV